MTNEEAPDLDYGDITAVLDGILGAFEAAQEGLEQAREGKTISLDEL